MTDAPYQGEARFRVLYEQPMLEDAGRSFVWRRMVREQPLFWAAELLMAGALIYRLAGGTFDWITFVLGTGVAIPPLLAAALWRAHYVNTLGQFRALSRPEADVQVDREGWSFTSDMGKGTLSWSRLTEIWRRPGYWILFWGPNQFNTLPDATVPPDLRAVLDRFAR